MKKNKMMRLASGLLVATLLTTSMISGTFAKYVTSASGNDTARVAKWGIEMNNDGFATFVGTYETDEVVSKAGDVVAPGTTGSSQFAITGAPETKYQITFDYLSDAELSDVYLGLGTYTYTGYDVPVETKVTTAYYPIDYTVVFTTNAGKITSTDTQIDASATGTYETLQEALEAIQKTKIDYNANVPCDAVVSVTWNWPYEQSEDAKDTILGDLSARDKFGDSVALSTESTDYSLDIKFTLKMTATQIGD